jgi:hypothetical protein
LPGGNVPVGDVAAADECGPEWRSRCQACPLRVNA